MPEGSNTYKGLAVPLMGESEIKQLHAGTDVLTLSGYTSMTGDFIIGQDSTGNEFFAVDNSGNVTVEGAAYTIGTNWTTNLDTDGNVLGFGMPSDGIGFEISITWDGTDLDIVGHDKGHIVKFGTVGTGLDVWFYGSEAGSRMIWDEGKGQLLMNVSGVVRTRLNMGASSSPPTSTIEYGDLFVARTGTTFKLGICSTGTTKKYIRSFGLTFGSAT